MFTSAGVVIWIFVSYLIYSATLKFVAARRNAAKSRELNCLDPPAQKNRLPFGIDNIRRALKADKDQLFPVDAIKRTHDVGANTYSYNVLGLKQIFTAEPKNIQAVLATQFQDFSLGRLRRAIFFPLLGNGIFTQDGQPWEHSRAMMRPQFARDQVSDLELEETHVQNLMRALPTTDKWTLPVDLSELFFHLTLDSACEFLFGESPNSQINAINVANGTAKQSDKDFANAFDKAQLAVATRFRFNEFHWLLDTPVTPKLRDSFKKHCTDCHDFIDHFVRLALSKGTKENVPDQGDVPTKKGKYVFLEALAAQVHDPIELRSQLLHILLAGRDTTASLLGWLCLSLARDPARYTKLRNSILDSFGAYEESGPEQITFVKLKNCTYLHHCINEALRLYPVVPINGRRAIRDTTLPTGGGPDGKSKIFVPAGTQVDYSVHVMQHRADIWGPDVEEFIPERWEGRKVGWEFLPFNGGPRICIGQQFALTEASYVIVRLLQRFETLENLETSEAIKHNLTLTNCSALGVKCRLREP